MDLGIVGAYAAGSIFIYLFHIICWEKLQGKKLEKTNWKIYVSILILTIIGTVINFLVPQTMKIGMMALMLLGINYFFFNKNIISAIILVILSELIIMISETVFITAISVAGLINPGDMIPNPIIIVGLNISIAIISFLILKIKAMNRIYKYLDKTVYNLKKNNFIFWFVATIFLASAFMILAYMRLPKEVILICNTVLIIIYAVTIFKLVNTQDKYQKISNKYETSLTSLKEYEDMMDRYRVANHENKNQLLTIRNMIKSKDKTTIDYIDKVVDNKIKDNENIFYKTSKIPEGGLRATIYAKLCKMAELKINYTLDISNDVRAVDLIKLGDDTVLNACKVIGVFLDNAIEEVSKLRKKEIIIELFVMDECLCIDISNRYKGNLELDKMENARFTTKGEGHGYGLTLVSEIIKSDRNLKNEKAVTKERFTQKLKIKM